MPPLVPEIKSPVAVSYFSFDLFPPVSSGILRFTRGLLYFRAGGTRDLILRA